MSLRTPSQAEAMLPEFRRILNQVVQDRRILKTLSAELEILEVITDSSDSRHNPDVREYVTKSIRYHRLQGRVQALEQRLDRLGCCFEIDDMEHVDLTFEQQGACAVYCWQVCSAEIAHWHYMHEPHSKRRRIDSASIEDTAT